MTGEDPAGAIDTSQVDPDEFAKNIGSANWLLIFPAVFLVSTLFALNFVGDGLRDALDPRDR